MNKWMSNDQPSVANVTSSSPCSSADGPSNYDALLANRMTKKMLEQTFGSGEGTSERSSYWRSEDDDDEMEEEYHDVNVKNRKMASVKK
jgi:broad specificity polyphosphatase/5'/3'-nucleotidase SurE